MAKTSSSILRQAVTSVALILSLLNNEVSSSSILTADAGLKLRSTSAVESRENVIGEELITEDNATAFADRMISEALRMWDSPASSGWKTLDRSNDLITEEKRVSGTFQNANVMVTRGQGTIPMAAQQLFDLLVSPEGHAIIDPFSKESDFSKPPLHTFSTIGWRTRSSEESKATTTKRLELARTTAKIPLLPFAKEREFVVLNAIDGTTRIFASKSVQHERCAGASKYAETVFPMTEKSECTPGKFVRALNTFVVDVQPSPEDSNMSVVRVINYADMVDLPAFAANFVNRLYVSSLYDRIKKAARQSSSGSR